MAQFFFNQEYLLQNLECEVDVPLGHGTMSLGDWCQKF